MSLAFAAAAMVRGAEPARRWATPDEIFAGRRMKGGAGGAADGSWTLYPGSKGLVKMDWKTGAESDIDVRWDLRAPASPADGSVLASWIWEEDRNMLFIGVPGKSRTRLFSLPRRLHMSEPVWSPDGRTIYVCAYLELPWPKSDPRDDHPPTRNKNVSIVATVAPYAYQRIGRRVLDREYPEAYGEENRTLLLAIDVASAQTRVVARGNDASEPYLSPDGKWIALVQTRKDGGRDGIRSDVYLVPTRPFDDLAVVDLEKYEERKVGWFDAANRRLSPVLAGVDTAIFSLVWSPDSARFVYGSVGGHSTGDLYAYDVAEGKQKDLTAAFTLPPWSKDLGYGENLTDSDRSPKFGSRIAPMWLPDGTGLVALGHGDAWLIPLDPSSPIRNLTKSVPQETIRVLPACGRSLAGTDPGGRLVVIAKDKASRRDSVYAVDPRTAAATLLSDTGLWIDVDPMFVDRGHGPLVLTGHTDRMDTNLFRLDMARASGARPPTQETRYKMELLQRRFPEARVLTWRTASGAFGGGVLYVPPGMPPGRKVPLVLSVHTPGDWTSQIDRWAAKGPQSVQDDILMSMKDGIAFLTPDVPMSDYGVYDHPMRQVVEGVQAAVDAALATGFIDADRLGIVGKDSFTPHQSVFVVESVLTQTDRFKVAVCSNLKPTSTNWVGDYGPTHKEYFELGQGRFAVPLWDDPGRYLENSPIAYWNRVKTPILYINGDDQTYSGLIRLGLTGVNAGSRESYQEKDIRIRAWLREHFFGDKPTVQKADIPSFFFGAPEDNDPQ